jgi:hypothetical protein
VALDRSDLEDRVLFRLTHAGVCFGTRPQGKASPTGRRRIGDRDPATCTHEVCWTQAFHLAAATMAALDTPRRQMELFCKAITQSLRIKTCLGTSAHAVMTPVWGALITDLILAFLRFQAGWRLSCQQLLRRLQMTLVDQRNLGDRCNPHTGDIAGRPLLGAI